ncbi:uncharacterized protein FOMMEDRAFT_160498 [Fomitiporia mediterranea MF3/22]|uniref:uncharacterized protein n=1 Tax=Fomitiporia mediterranea (strain MF3/22) TaxID=694068 RepID=UPI0004408FD6|nr:uncharacterized protein FOMMEDRAFT_160498 [Fomitiporia mediterranea MF3/22]EJC99445.1 hypothetical protein FOMMEDRAFT_160498 [Fomitiporia mediterranea MF3/22]
MLNEFFNNSMHSSRSAAQAAIDKHTPATISMYDHSQGVILSPGVAPARTLLPHPPFHACQHPRWTPTAHCSHLSKLSPSTASTLPSPFVPERPRDTPLQSKAQFTVPPIGRLRISSFNAPDLDLHAPLTLAAHRHGAALPLGQNAPGIHPSVNSAASPAAQISSFNTPDLNPSAPLTLATCHCGVSISSIQLPTHADNTHAHTLS